MQLNKYIDHTVLKPTTTLEDIKNLCMEAVEYDFAAVCVPPPFVKVAKTFTSSTSTKVATVIGFPFGYSAIEAKLAELVLAIVDEADEVDMVANLLAIRNKDWDYIEKEINNIMAVIRNQPKKVVLKVIIESGILLEEEIIKCCEIYAKYGVDYVKTSTGYAEKGASVEAVKLMRAHLPQNIQIKASGGVRTFTFAQELIAAGATRLGTSSGVALMKEAKGEATTGATGAY
ncbi:deoxyribose-phosphate aldolase [Chitinophaga sancti]|uniref:Deoxyribose-phosphate aldolase n=1 Tax=Chitinophaga sancti TaxID=1004 RepID=A0A1K1PJL2_9BACT|nr:deoxyribose-phosphate aldolase [Chitinophaga sancti]WQD59477.1 deoxyribose-phosphate aldolase [Chitinophaga sancti]WQG88389.1 deoxyribose-phosphate aldolase [Chitinophaga sancti]SFW47986.1 deoxyribose-phosphate aldolase [Chitinophaga sancti]